MRALGLDLTGHYKRLVLISVVIISRVYCTLCIVYLRAYVQGRRRSLFLATRFRSIWNIGFDIRTYIHTEHTPLCSVGVFPNFCVGFSFLKDCSFTHNAFYKNVSQYFHFQGEKSYIFAAQQSNSGKISLYFFLP